MTTPTSRILGELADREAIRECLYRYARGVDRLDADMVRSAYWPEVIDNHIYFTGNAEEFIAWAFPRIAEMDQAQHFISNILMTLRGNTADVESYFYGYQSMNGPNGKYDNVGGGRYLDHFEKRGQEWRIIQRTVVKDWFRNYPDSADGSNGMMGFKIEPGGRFPDDDSYQRIRLG